MVTEPYSRFAEVYDRVGCLNFSEKVLPYLHQLLKRYRLPGKKVLDLACGTGELARELARDGFEVVGLDRSASMLKKAKEKAKQDGLEIPYLHQDMRDFRLPHKVDLVTCLFDSINYILRYDELEAVFGNVHQALTPGGMFIFDMNTIFGLSSGWDNRKTGEDLGDLAVIWDYSWDEGIRLATLEVTVFQRKGNLYRKFKEVHRERGYDPKSVAKALKRKGLEVLDRFRCLSFTKPRRDTQRVMWVCRRTPDGS